MIGKKLRAVSRWAMQINTDGNPNNQRGQPLGFFLGLVILAVAFLTAINISELLLMRSQGFRFILFDFLTLFSFIILWILNRKGKVDLAAHISLTVCIVATTFIFEPQDLIHAFAIFTIPILLSSFVLSAVWAFFYTTLAVAGYSLIYFLTTPASDYEYLIIISLYTFAGISYLIASRYNTAIQNAQASEERFRTLFERVPVGLYRTNADGDVLAANPTLLKMFGYQDLESFQKLNAAQLYARQDDHSNWLENFTNNAINDELIIEIQLRRSDGSIFWGSDATRAVKDENGQLLYYEGSLTDISKRKKTEDALLKSEERFRNIFENATVGIYRTTPGGDILLANQTLIKMLGYESLEELVARNLAEDGFEPEYPRNNFQERIEHEGEIRGLEAAWKRKDGSTIYIRESAKAVRDQSGRTLYYEGTVEDISDRKVAEDKIQEHVEQLTALRKIDTTINSSTDLRLCLNTILTEAIRLLNVDAADILLLNPNIYRLEFAAGHGFHTRNFENRSIHLGKGPTGKVALENQKFEIHNLNENALQDFNHFKAENFTCYRCIPLIVKGKIQGVLETYYRQHEQHPPKWPEFLDTLAGQAAIAIDNALLFEELQQSNFDLTIAYDQVIEGWARALDLREKEFSNHTQNVTEITLQLVSAMGFQDRELLNIRYGALLHDIGKMGIPDQILLKQGKLTKKEWEMVYQHPQIAYDLLRKIPYLRPALEIPYAHHEKWDGSGYPRGLAGEDIPLPARIFAIADVYEALISDRPYRKKWSKKKALEYIKSQSGKHFDPDVVDVFLREFG